MTYEDTFRSVFGNSLPFGKSAFAVQLPNNTENPISYITPFLGEDGGKVMIKSNVYYICSATCNHPEVIRLLLE